MFKSSSVIVRSSAVEENNFNMSTEATEATYSVLIRNRRQLKDIWLLCKKGCNRIGQLGTEPLAFGLS